MNDEPTEDNTRPDEAPEPTVDGQCQEPGCKSTRVPNGDPYTCPVHVKQ